VNLIYLLMLVARMLSEQAWRQEEEPEKVAIQNCKNLDLWVLGPWKDWHASWFRRINNSIRASPLCNSRNIK
jgi:hypothetical protein